MERATELVVELLSKNISQVEVARITGNTESAISQVATTYREQIQVGRKDQVLAAGVHGSRLDKLEALAADKLESCLDLETDTMKIANIFKTLNSAIRRDAGESGGSGGNTTTNTQNVVQLTVPQHLRATVAVQTNSQNDVVAVAGRDLTPASMRDINTLAGIETGAESNETTTRNQAFDDIMQATIPGLDPSPEF